MNMLIKFAPSYWCASHICTVRCGAGCPFQPPANPPLPHSLQVLAHRLGLIPILADPREFTMTEKGEKCIECTCGHSMTNSRWGPYMYVYCTHVGNAKIKCSVVLCCVTWLLHTNSWKKHLYLGFLSASSHPYRTHAHDLTSLIVLSASFELPHYRWCVVAEDELEEEQQVPEVIPEVSEEEVLVFELKVKCSKLPCPPEGATVPEELYMNAKGELLLKQAPDQRLTADTLRSSCYLLSWL